MQLKKLATFLIIIVVGILILFTLQQILPGLSFTNAQEDSSSPAFIPFISTQEDIDPTPTLTPIPNNPTPTPGDPTPTSVPDNPTPTPTPTSVPANTFLETFDGDPSQPEPWQSANFDATVHMRDPWNLYEIDPMQAAHGPNCEPPPDTHPVSAYKDTVYNCKNHVMTAINSEGYGLIYLTPNQLADFSNGEAKISFDVSTLRTSGRDWIDIWVTPFDDNLQLPLQDWLPDLSGEPRNAVHIAMDFEVSIFKGEIHRNFVTEEVPGTEESSMGYESFLVPDAKRRDTFVLYISNTHIKFGMPDYDHWWIDTDIAPLGWDQGVVQIGHHSYNPKKECASCEPNTWHWDNILIQPAIPFTMLKADRRYVDADASIKHVNLTAATPEDAYLRFSGIGFNLEVSFDNGNTWQAAQLQTHKYEPLADEHFKSYWMPIPEGVEQVYFRGENWWGGIWHMRDITVWSRSAP